MTRIRSSHATPPTKRASDWRDTAACREEDPELFFASPLTDAGAQEVEHAKTLCRRCPSKDSCLQFALDQGITDGIYGGLTEQERGGLGPAPPPESQPVRKERTFQTLWDERSTPIGDGHTGWRGAVPVALDGRYYTPQQISFRVGRGRAPSGIVRRTCDRDGCVLPAHLMDQAERDARRAAEAAVAQAAAPTPTPASTGRRLAPCGTRSAYQRHIRNREPIDDACRAENSAARNRLTRTGTTKALV